MTDIVANSVNGVGYIAPGVNGVVGNGSTDDTTAIQNILNTYQSIRWGPGTYLISKTLNINVNGFSWEPRIQGCGLGTYILASNSFTGSAAIQLNGAVGTTVDFHISGLSIVNETAGQGANYGLSLTPTSTGTMGGLTKSCIEDMYISGFAFNYLIHNWRLGSKLINFCAVTIRS
jgi:hypothetical protein